MAVILSIETSTPTSSIALHEDGKLISSQHIHVDKSHAEYLTLSIKNLLETSEFSMKSVNALAVSKGPGSYTGLRIGTSTAKGICYALDVPLIAINTLEAMAYGMAKLLYEDVLLCPMIDARRMEVFCTVTNKELSIIENTSAKIIDIDSYSNLLSKHKMIFFGNGAMKCSTTLSHQKNAIFISGISPSAEHIGELAWHEYQQNHFENVAYFEPYYLKDFVAKKPSVNKLV